MQFTAAQIASLVQGRIEGNSQAVVHSFGKIEEAQEGQLSFLANAKYEDFIYATKASVVLVNENFQPKQAVPCTLIRVDDAYMAFAALLEKYHQIITEQLSGIEPLSYVAATAVVGAEAYIGAFAYVGERVKLGNNVKIFPGVYLGNDVTIGNNVVLYAGVKIYERCQIGNNVIIHAGAVIGADGFGFAPQPDGSYKKIPQIGNVVIEDDVEIGANTTIDCATLGSTIIKKGAKLDNLIQIAHNVEVGAHTAIAAQAGISGSTEIGNYVIIGGQAGIVGHVQIADKARINAQSGVSKSIHSPIAVTGSPAYEYMQVRRVEAMTRRLPEMEQRIRELEKMVEQLKSQLIN